MRDPLATPYARQQPGIRIVIKRSRAVNPSLPVTARVLSANGSLSPVVFQFNVNIFSKSSRGALAPMAVS